MLPGSPERESATWAELPDLLPLVRQEDVVVPYVLVEIDRTGADLTVRGPTGAVLDEEQVDGDAENISKVPAGDGVAALLRYSDASTVSA